MSAYRIAVALILMVSSMLAQSEDTRSEPEITLSLKLIAADVQSVLVQEQLNNAYDVFARLSEHGLTWQPSLLAPNDLAGRLDDEQLRMYAGIKLFDAIYAATFRQPKVVAEAVAVIEAVHNRLDLRSAADMSGALLTVLGRAAADPSGVDLDKTFGDLAAGLIKDVPVLMSSPQGADYLVDSLFGFWLQQTFMRIRLHALAQQVGDFTLDRGALAQPDRGEWETAMLTLLKAMAPLDQTPTIPGSSIGKVDLIAETLAAYQADTTPEGTAATWAQWGKLEAETTAARAAILTPGH